MADGSVLANLHFGREDAERDVTEGLLPRGGFPPNAAYRAAVTGRKMLIIGRKGSGKSAVCMQLMADSAYTSGKILVTPDETAGEEIRRFELQGLPGDSAKALIWRSPSTTGARYWSGACPRSTSSWNAYAFGLFRRHVRRRVRYRAGGGERVDGHGVADEFRDAEVQDLGRSLRQPGARSISRVIRAS
ncbi:hypothetical protein [Streptomyces sp. NBC_01477]|uniref:hypothetical protein n=1 Tax=Streptomyces sp. NBC_01477 TaxID=2976015 RepID=UPI003FCDCF5D